MQPTSRIWAAFVVVAAGCVTPALAVGDPSPVLERDPYYEQARALIRERRYGEALPALDRLRRDFPEQAEIHSLTGFVLRKTGRLDEAFGSYERALALDPSHRGANEYLGELFLTRGQIGLAKERLSVLNALCPSGCEEAEDLAHAIGKA